MAYRDMRHGANLRSLWEATDKMTLAESEKFRSNLVTMLAREVPEQVWKDCIKYVLEEREQRKPPHPLALDVVPELDHREWISILFTIESLQRKQPLETRALTIKKIRDCYESWKSEIIEPEEREGK